MVPPDDAASSLSPDQAGWLFVLAVCFVAAILVWAFPTKSG